MFQGGMMLGYNVDTVSWFYNVMMSRYHGVTVSWCHGNMVSRYYYVTVLWCHGVRICWCHGVTGISLRAVDHEHPNFYEHPGNFELKRKLVVKNCVFIL